MSGEKRSPSQKQRYDVIFEALTKRRTMKIAEIQDLLGVSGMTVRRYLDDLQREGVLRRVHGGAAIVDLGTRISGFNQRLSLNTETKLALARYAFDLVPDRGSVFIDGGTTCFQLIKLLRKADKKCVVITDGVAGILELGDRQGGLSILIGGQLGEDGNSMDGPMAVDMASRMSVDVAFFSSTGFDDERAEQGTLAGFLVKKVMLQKAARRVCMIDSGKYQNQMCFHFYGWEDVDMLITDSGLPDSARQAIAGKGVDVRIVDPGPKT